tara:strand:+ start:24179 stop:25291 length:1113 start_codon:yes stop_codon:yes gene_type:complete
MKDIYVNKPYLPDINLVNNEMQNIWSSKILSNNGPYHKKFEEELSRYLNVPYVSLFNNCTTALLIAIKALDIKGEVITTPYTFVASSSALVWNNIKPIFVDIELDSLNINYKQIESKINKNTVGILGVHSYGNPCKISEIKEISDRHKLKLIYDGAAAFGSTFNKKTVLAAGDCSVVSFHATKILNTFEGGAVISSTKKLKSKIDSLKNFGMNEYGMSIELGINGKLNEFNSMIGCLQLREIDEIINKRKKLSKIYTEKLKNFKGIYIPNFVESDNYNNSYYPILFEEKNLKSRDVIYRELTKKGIFCKKYYNPLISDINTISKEYAKIDIPISKYVSKNVLCLPLYPDLSFEEQKKVYQSLIKILQTQN